jgi:hypothetical protein
MNESCNIKLSLGCALRHEDIVYVVNMSIVPTECVYRYVKFLANLIIKYLHVVVFNSITPSCWAFPLGTVTRYLSRSILPVFVVHIFCRQILSTPFFYDDRIEPS